MRWSEEQLTVAQEALDQAKADPLNGLISRMLIMAIKEVRTKFGMTLLESKQLVEYVMGQRTVKTFEVTSMHSPNLEERHQLKVSYGNGSTFFSLTDVELANLQTEVNDYVRKNV
jgi:hypothetical protein